MVSTDVLVDFRCAAEFAKPHHQRVLQQTSVFQILQQNRQSVVCDRQVPFGKDLVHSRVVEAMSIPATVSLAASANTSGKVDGHKLHP